MGFHRIAAAVLALAGLAVMPAFVAAQTTTYPTTGTTNQGAVPPPPPSNVNNPPQQYNNAPPPSGQAPMPANAIPPGTTISGTLQQPINTKTAQVGDTFALSETRSNYNNLAGATIQGHVENVVKAGQGRPAQLQLAFDRVVMPDGTTFPIAGSVVSMDQKKNESPLARGAVGAAVGDVVGNVLGKWTGASFWSNTGGLLGAAGGYLYASNAKVDFTVPSGTPITLQTSPPQQRNQQRMGS